MSASLSADLEAALLRELRRVYDHVNDVHFANRLKKPVLTLTDSTHKLGRWLPATRTLELARPLVISKPWLEVRSVLEHEMAHQYVDEVLKIKDEPPHGPTFTRVCVQRGIDARAAGVPVGSITANAPEDRVLERIRKLLALAGSENQHEAELAMKKAHELMLRHNIEHAQTASQSYDVIHLGSPSRRASPVELEVMGIISEFFFVEVIRVPIYRPTEGVHAQVFEVIGTHENVAMAEHVHAFLMATADRLWKENRTDRRVRSGRDRSAYQSGVMRGFRDKLVGERNDLAGAGLVWVGDGNLETFFRARYPRIQTRRRYVRATGAHAAGREAGRNVVLHKPVTSSGSSGRLLPGR